MQISYLGENNNLYKSDPISISAIGNHYTIELKNIEELFEEKVEDYHPAHIDVLKSYKSYKQKQQDIPFTPRHNF